MKEALLILEEAENEISVRKYHPFWKDYWKENVWIMFSNNWGSENITFPEENLINYLTFWVSFQMMRQYRFSCRRTGCCIHASTNN